MRDFELGYTPENLRKIIKDNGLAQKEVYELLGKTRAAFSRYLMPSDNKYHVSMNHADWIKLLNYVNKASDNL